MECGKSVGTNSQHVQLQLLTHCISSHPITYAQAKAEAKKLLSGL